MRRLFFITLVLLFQSTYSQELRHQVFFDTDVYAISNREQQKLIHFIEDLDLQNLSSIDIYGFCDDRASFEYNIVLSNNRANSVRNMLVKHNVPQEKLITILGKGEVPLSTTIEAEIPKVRQSNRKVEIIVNGIGENTNKGNVPLKNSYNKLLIIRGYPNDNSELLKGELNVGDKIRFEDLYFEIGYPFLIPKSKKELEKIAKILVERKNIFFTIEGHVCCTKDDSDAINRATKKRNLSVARAEYIFNYLERKGVEKYRMKFKGMQRKHPLGGDPKYDRRVEFLITYVGD
jgi:outer membrane protein OmpA-like peptidoglycan-associated protein